MARLTELPPGHPPPSAVGGLVLRTLETPLGDMLAGAVGSGVCLLEFAGGRRVDREQRELERLLASESTTGATEHLDRLADELRAYFAGERAAFSVPLLTPGTDFERAVWGELLLIPAGETRSYGHIAAVLGDPTASRAVGQANGRNRIAIVVPCHRVINTGGGLGGYGGGLQRKSWLLEHERRLAGGEAMLFDTCGE